MFQPETTLVAAATPNAKSKMQHHDVYTHSVLVVRDDAEIDAILTSICGFLELSVEFVTSGVDIGPILCSLYPIAVITDLEGDVQDGFHIMKIVASYTRKLPILLLTKNEAPLQGAVAAVKEIWQLAHVSTAEDVFHIADVIDFLCQAARDAGRMRMVRI